MSASAWTPVDEKDPQQNSAWKPVEEARPDFAKNPPPAAGPHVNIGETMSATQEESTPEGHQAAIERREQGGRLKQFGIGVAKAGGMIPFAESVPRALSGDQERPDLSARGPYQKAGKVVGAGAMIAPGLVTAPGPTLKSLGGGLAGQFIGSTGAELAGASPNAQDIAGDVGGVAGGIAANHPLAGQVGRTAFNVAKDFKVTQPLKSFGDVPKYWEQASPETRFLAETNKAVREGRAAKIPTRLPSQMREWTGQEPSRPVGKPAPLPGLNRMVLTPEEQQRVLQLQKIATQRASQIGMQHAGNMKPFGPPME